MDTDTLFKNLSAALRHLLIETENLARAPSSYGWNQAYAHVENAQRDYDAIIIQIKDAHMEKKA